MSAGGGQPEESGGSAAAVGAAPPTGGSLRLEAGWDAALTYDVLDAQPAEQPVFVGREDLLGSLVNAISQPDRRGTYLVSGYRGAGKTSLVIEAARRATAPLEAGGRELLPLVLNVSEVSASLEPASDTQTPPLGIDARRLLTALLRALRNGLQRRTIEDGGELVARVRLACRKAEAAQYTERAKQLAEIASTEVVTSTRSFQAPQLLKVLAGVVGLAAVGVEAVALFGASTAALQTLAAALAGGAVLSFTASRTSERKATKQDLADTELVFDNSLHQVESDLKDILADLHEQRFRTMFVLEELDKVEDEEGQQLDAVIRYFKNLFTQAPALFFFLTDKRYFDLVDDKIAAARARGSYAVEHTFFTHRLFVSRPAVQECLDYFGEVLRDPEASDAIDHIRGTGAARYRPAGEMTATERFLRVLLFASQNHLFDLKNEMRRYVRVDASGSRLEFDDNSFPPQEHALAAFHFLLEQKADLYHFGGGRDYANEILRNCLSAVFADLGGDAVLRAAELYPEPGGLGAQLRMSERKRIAEGVDSLLSDLERGRAIEPVVTATDDGRREPAFRWRPDAAVGFTPVPKLESHEQALVDQLERASRVCRQMTEDGPLAGVVDRRDEAAALATAHAATIEDVRRARRPMTVEDAQARSAALARQLASLLGYAQALHQVRLSERGWQVPPALDGVDESVRIVTAIGDPSPGRVVVVHGTEEPHQASVQRTLAELPPGPAAVVLVDDDPGADEAARHAVLARWRTAIAQPDRPLLVTLVPLSEELADGAAAETRWGERTSDEIVLATLWASQDLAPLPPGIGDGPVWLRRSGEAEQRCDGLAEAVERWLAGTDRVLGAPPSAGNDAIALTRTVAKLATGSDRPRLLLDPSAPLPILPAPTPGAGDPVDRLIEAGRLIALYAWIPAQRPQSELARAVVTAHNLPDELAGLARSLLRSVDDASAIRGLAEFVGPVDDELTSDLYRQAADAGDPLAMAELIGRLRSPDAVAEWTGRLLDTRDWSSVVAAADRLGDDARAGRLLLPAAEDGFPPAMARMVGLTASDPEASRSWMDRLVTSGDASALRDAARRVPDAERAARLLEAAAERGDTEAMAELIRRGGPDGERWEKPLVAAGSGLQLWSLAREFDQENPERGLRFHRFAADAREGDVDSMVEVLVRCASTDPEASRENQARLAEHEDWGRLRGAAERLRESHPDRAAEIEALLPGGRGA